MNSFQKIDIALIAGLIIALMVSSVSAFEKDLDDISDRVLRIHILANSNSQEDQNLKLKVRDNILEKTRDKFVGCTTRLEVENVVLNNLDYIKSVANDTIINNGYSYNVDAKLVNMKFNTRIYDDITFPAGDYDALRVTIGSAEGKNWWCVMFPQLCISPSIKKTDKETNSDNIEKTSDRKIDKEELENIDKEKLENITESDIEKIKEDKLEIFEENEAEILEKPQKFKVKFFLYELFKDIKSLFC